MSLSDPFAMLAEKYNAPNYALDVKRWAWDRLGIFLWSLQADIANAVPEERNVLVRSCHDSGKTFGAAVICAHHIDSHPPGSARIITTAPSKDQVRGLLWNEINKIWERAAARGNPLPGNVNQTELWIGSFQAGIGRKPSDYKEYGFSGFHAEYPLVVADEADRIPKTLWDSLDTILTNRKAKLFGIGNPDDPTSEFAAMQKRPGYRVFKIPAWDTPNFTDEDVPQLLRDVLLSPEWVEERRLRWGGLKMKPGQIPDHPFWFSKVEAEYPDESDLTIVRSADIERCMHNDSQLPRSAARALGVDVAGSERGDYTVVRERYGPFALREWQIQTSDPVAIEDFLVAKALEANANIITIDATGIGFGFVAGLRRRLPAVTVQEFQFGSGAKDKDHFLNKRAELYWMGRTFSRDMTWDLTHGENIEDTVAQLISVRRVADASKIQVEDKADVIRRIGRSPDNADALLLAFWSMRSGHENTISSASGTTLPTGASAMSGRTMGGIPNRGGAGIVLPTRTAARR